jgi:HK97 family phage prohead protease
VLTHSYQLRDATVKGRTLTVACVPYDTPAPVMDTAGEVFLEQFTRGAFRNAVKAPHLVQLRYEHRQDGPPYALGLELREDPKYLVGTWRVAPSGDGDRLIGLVVDDQLRGASVGFEPGDHPGDNALRDNVVTRSYVKRLHEVSLTAAPVYDDAKVLELRSRRAADLTKARERERWRWRTLTLD